jgi:hypothetical protein
MDNMLDNTEEKQERLDSHNPFLTEQAYAPAPRKKSPVLFDPKIYGNEKYLKEYQQDNEGFKKQLFFLIEKFKELADKIYKNIRIQNSFELFKKHIFDPAYTGTQPKQYFTDIKQLLEEIFAWLIQEDKIVSLARKKQELRALSVGLPVCGSGVYLHLHAMVNRLFTPISLAAWTADARENLVDQFAEKHIQNLIRKLKLTDLDVILLSLPPDDMQLAFLSSHNRQILAKKRADLMKIMGSAIHVREFYKTTANEVAAFGLELAKVKDEFATKKYCEISDNNVVDFMCYLSREYNPEFIITTLKIRIFEEIHRRAEILGIKKQGKFFSYDQKFYAGICELFKEELGLGWHYILTLNKDCFSFEINSNQLHAQLLGILTDKVKFFSNVYCEKEVCTEVKLLVPHSIIKIRDKNQENIYRSLTTAIDLGNMLADLSSEKCKLVCIKLKENIKGLLKTPENVGEILSKLSHAQCVIASESCKDIMQSILKDIMSFRKVMRYLDADQCKVVTSVFKEILQKIIKTPYDVEDILYDLSADMCKVVCETLDLFLSESVKTPDAFGEIMQRLYTNHCEISCKSFQNFLPCVIKNVNDFRIVLSYLSLDKSKIVCKAFKEQNYFSRIVKTLPDFVDLLNAFQFSISAAELCKVIASKPDALANEFIQAGALAEKKPGPRMFSRVRKNFIDELIHDNDKNLEIIINHVMKNPAGHAAQIFYNILIPSNAEEEEVTEEKDQDTQAISKMSDAELELRKIASTAEIDALIRLGLVELKKVAHDQSYRDRLEIWTLLNTPFALFALGKKWMHVKDAWEIDLFSLQELLTIQGLQALSKKSLTIESVKFPNGITGLQLRNFLVTKSAEKESDALMQKTQKKSDLHGHAIASK